MDPIKEAFSKVKQDIFLLQSQISDIKRNLQEIKRTLQDHQQNQTIRQINQTHPENQTDIPQKEAPNPPISRVSTGNDGVQTDRQTIRQTDTSPQKFAQSEDSYFNQGLKNSPEFAQSSTNQPQINIPINPQFPPQTKPTNQIDHLEKVSQILGSLDSLKKELRLKFKKLTNQEMCIFSSIYQLEEQGLLVDYPLLSTKLGLSESSIRDYVKNIIKKGAPVVKTKQDNKKIILSIPNDLKKMASLQTILQLRAL
jgi:hypothetical protein